MLPYSTSLKKTRCIWGVSKRSRQTGAVAVNSRFSKTEDTIAFAAMSFSTGTAGDIILDGEKEEPP
jgi:hypothetical protein